MNIGKVGVAVGLIWWLVASGKLKTADLGRALTPGAVAFSLGAIGLTFIFAILRWWELLGAIDIRLSLWTTTKLTFIGGFFNTFMPGAVGGDAFKMYYVVDHAPAGKKVEAATTVAVDRVVGLGAMFVLVAVAACVTYANGIEDPKLDSLMSLLRNYFGAYAKPLAALAFVGALLGLATFHRGVRDWAIVRRIRERVPGMALGDRIAHAFLGSVRSPWPLFLAVVYSVASHLFTVGCFYVFGRALGVDLPLGRYILVVPIGLMVNAIPGPPSGIGLGEASYDVLFATMGAPGVGATLCLCWRLVTFAWNGVGGVAYVLHRRGEPDPALLKSEDPPRGAT